ncbi:RuBisCO large subunit C-terminal-like domain-containing protein [Megasphaera sueciensis]|uniref:RuBisCO large subunit C-terminal-like domain-containing protein n=1 Tax=Megasphaera sueciensis TaxID=349094 RepID=UPI003D04BF57|nr:RuBisCO large subunit C-terminal-like domain-containing protein [Megasphaera sp.]
MIKEKSFSVLYRITADSKEEAQNLAQKIAVEQTIEFPPDLVERQSIFDNIVGNVKFTEYGDGQYRYWITYNDGAAGTEITQLFNVVFGNSSMQPGIWVEDIEFSSAFLSAYHGPHFGIAGIRELLGVFHRPLLHCVIKPLGSTTAELAHMAYEFAAGGADLIKDDHGITNQASAPFAERVAACAEAVRKANKDTGGHAVYVANCTADGTKSHERALQAKKLGAGGILLAPVLTGFGMIREIADDPLVGLPIISHPSLSGGFIMPGLSGVVMSVLYGVFSRLAGADAVVFPSYGGRFTFTADDCKKIAESARNHLGKLAAIFPSPGGGITEETIPKLAKLYGRDVIYLVGGGIFRHGPDLLENTKFYKMMIQEIYS